jgi:DNA polymerase-4
VRAILHVDMDAFYASVEQRDDPSLRGRPVVVAGASRRAVVCAASYEVRPFGVRSAMPIGEALRRAPHAVVVAPRMARYAAVSAQVFAIFRRFSPLVEGLSLDEAFIDVTGSRGLFGEPASIAAQIKKAVRDELGLTCSAGVASSKFAAKIASDLQKPDGLVVVPEDVAAFLAPLPVERMWGVGPKTAVRVRAAGFSTIGDLARSDPAALERLFGAWGRTVHALASGVDAREVVPDHDAQSVGAEETLEHDLHTVEAIEAPLLAQCERVAGRLVANGLRGRVVTLKLRYADFTARTRQVTLDAPVADTGSIHRAARALLTRMPGLRRGVRLVGVSMGGLESAEDAVPQLFPDERAARGLQIEDAAAKLRARFGERMLTRAALLDAPGNSGPRRR